jgi:hypothetical protein
MIKLEDQHRDPALLSDEMERTFGEHYLANLRRSPPFVHLEGESIVNQPTCITRMLISVMQECTRRARDVWSSSK